VLDSSPFLQQLLAGQGLTDAPLRWPTNVSFLALLHAVGVTRPGFAVDIGAGDGQRLDNYKRPLNPVLPLFRAGWAGLSVEEDAVYDGRGGGAQSKGMPFASARRSEVLALHNASGGIRVAWAAALPSTISALLAAAGAPTELDALHVDVDGLELPLLRAVLDAGYQPKVVALQFNADVPPPVYWSMAWREGGARPAGHQRVSAGPSAAALWHALSELRPSGSRYSLVAFQLGRWARWCQRCEQRMWFVRRPLLGAGAAPLISLAQLSRMFWAAVVASTLAPRVPPRAQTSRPRHTAAHPKRRPIPAPLPALAALHGSRGRAHLSASTRGGGIAMRFRRAGAARQAALALEPRGEPARTAGRGAGTPRRRARAQRQRTAPPPPPPPPPGGGPLARLKREQAGMVPPGRPLPPACADPPASRVGDGSAVRLGGWRGRSGSGWRGGGAVAAATALAVGGAARPGHDAAARGRARGRDAPVGRPAPSGRCHAHAHAAAWQIRPSLRPPRPAGGVCARAAAARLLHRRAARLRRVRLRDGAGA
jgi:hypothetical protein